MEEEKKSEEKEPTKEPSKEAAAASAPYPLPYPPMPYPPPPPPMELREEPLSPEEREKLTQLKVVSYLSFTICLISLISFIVGLIYFNRGLDVEAGGFRSLDTMRGVLLMGLSGLFLFGMYTFILMGLRKLNL